MRIFFATQEHRFHSYVIIIHSFDFKLVRVVQFHLIGLDVNSNCDVDQQPETLVVTTLELALGEPNFKFIKPNETTIVPLPLRQQIVE